MNGVLAGALLLFGCGGRSVELDPGAGAGQANDQPSSTTGGSNGGNTPNGVGASTSLGANSGASYGVSSGSSGGAGPVLGTCDIPQWDVRALISVPLSATSEPVPAGTFTACRNDACYSGIVSGTPLTITDYPRQVILVTVTGQDLTLTLNWSLQAPTSGPIEAFRLAYSPPNSSASVTVIDTSVSYSYSGLPLGSDCTMYAKASLSLAGPVDLDPLGAGGEGGAAGQSGNNGGSSAQAGGAAGAD